MEKGGIMSETQACITLEQSEAAFNAVHAKFTVRLALQQKIQGQIHELETLLKTKSEVDIVHLLEQSEGEFTDEIERLITQESQSGIEYKITELRRLEQQIELEVFMLKAECAKQVAPYQKAYIEQVKPLFQAAEKQAIEVIEKQLIPLIYRFEALRKMCYPHMQHNQSPRLFWGDIFPRSSLQHDLKNLIDRAFQKQDYPAIDEDTLPADFPGEFPQRMVNLVRTAPTPAEYHKVVYQHPKWQSPDSQEYWERDRHQNIEKHQDK